ncbi:unnamed protein product [Closterium sp. NIES-64]|nr:unnamed protein product [Closterium sp. NIES-64]CAI5953329.1 unnamed protein product [Closterium sp. NIES-64]
MRRLEVFIRERYIDCGQQFGAGSSALLSPFLARHGAACSRSMKVQGVDTDGVPREHEFTLHEEPIPGYAEGVGDLPSCIRTCRSFATELLYNLDFRLGDLSNLNAAKLFMPRSWPRGKEARDAECKGHMEKLAVMFHARDRDEILPAEKRDHHHAAEEGDDDAVDSGRDNAEDDASEDDQVEAEDDDEGY